MACNHPRDRWIGTAQGIVCGVCGQPVDGGKKAEPVKAPAPEKDEPKKAAPKKGAKK